MTDDFDDLTPTDPPISGQFPIDPEAAEGDDDEPGEGDDDEPGEGDDAEAHGS